MISHRLPLIFHRNAHHRLRSDKIMVYREPISNEKIKYLVIVPLGGIKPKSIILTYFGFKSNKLKVPLHVNHFMSHYKLN